MSALTSKETSRADKLLSSIQIVRPVRYLYDRTKSNQDAAPHSPHSSIKGPQMFPLHNVGYLLQRYSVTFLLVLQRLCKQDSDHCPDS